MTKPRWRAYLAIDPGKEGGWAALYPDKTLEAGRTPVIRTSRRCPRRVTKPRMRNGQMTKGGKPSYDRTCEYDLEAMLEVCREFRRRCREMDVDPVVTIERQRVYQKQKGALDVGLGMGYWLMALHVARLPVPPRTEWANPDVWKLCYVPVKADKKESLMVARQLYPRAPLPTLADEGVAEAILLCDWRQRADRGIPYPLTPPPKPRKERTA